MTDMNAKNIISSNNADVCLWLTATNHGSQFSARKAYASHKDREGKSLQSKMNHFFGIAMIIVMGDHTNEDVPTAMSTSQLLICILHLGSKICHEITTSTATDLKIVNYQF
jgi:hypothetical protein